MKDIEKETFKIVSKNEKVPSNPKKWKTKSKSLFPSSWTYEEIAQAMKKAEELIVSGNNGKLVKKLDEETFERYCKEG